jgi:hypothetical protein
MIENGTFKEVGGQGANKIKYKLKETQEYI